MAFSITFSNCLIYLIIIILCTTITRTAIKISEEKHFQVNSLLKKNFIYKSIKNKTGQKSPRIDETFWEKEDICMSIIKSDWMKIVYHLNVIDLHEEETFVKVEQDYPSIYFRSYIQYTSASKDATLENPYRLRNITIRNDDLNKLTFIKNNTSEKLPEYVFSCLAKNRHTLKIVEYFISPEYDFKVPIRFIFEYNEIGEMVPIGIAIQFTPGSENVEKYLEEFKRGNETAVFNIGSISVSDHLKECRKESEERQLEVLRSIPRPSAILFSPKKDWSQT